MTTHAEEKLQRLLLLCTVPTKILNINSRHSQPGQVVGASCVESEPRQILSTTQPHQQELQQVLVNASAECVFSQPFPAPVQHFSGSPVQLTIDPPFVEPQLTVVDPTVAIVNHKACPLIVHSLENLPVWTFGPSKNNLSSLHNMSLSTVAPAGSDNKVPTAPFFGPVISAAVSLLVPQM